MISSEQMALDVFPAIMEVARLASGAFQNILDHEGVETLLVLP